MTTLVLGGGVVGLSVAYGLLKSGEQVTVIDGADDDFRSSRGNFGLIWVSGKGRKSFDYSRWTRQSAALWPGFAAELQSQTGSDVSLVQNGGLDFCTSESELEKKIESFRTFDAAWDGDYPFQILDRAAIAELEPKVGPKVIGGIFCPMDGHVNPLLLLRTLSAAVRQKGGIVRTGRPVVDVTAADRDFTAVLSDGSRLNAERVVLCAGLGAGDMGPKLGFRAPVRPQQGQIIITEKLPPFLNYPSLKVRQVNEGGVQIGASNAEVGYDDAESTQTLSKLARDAIDIFPDLAKVKMVRSWAALRVMTPDSLPIYQRSEAFSGASFVTCHSGITLAAAHADLLPSWILGKNDAPDLSAFRESRFDV